MIPMVFIFFASSALIELYAPTSSTQKLKLMGRGGHFTYTPTTTQVPLQITLPQYTIALKIPF